MHSPAYCRTSAYRDFATALDWIETTDGLVRAATAIARHEFPHADPAKVSATLDQLAAAVGRAAPSGRLQARLAHLHDILFDVVGFRGNTDDYYNPANSYLPEVLRTRQGIPITLVLVYKAVAERIGIHVEGINAPGHFLAAIQDVETRSAGSAAPLLVDPFYGGVVLDRDEAVARLSLASGRPIEPADYVFSPATHDQWLMRMLNNLVAIFAHTGRERDALAMQELQAVLGAAAGSAREW
jgi:regulator of sirC expression with transglutaminase-like and TPR domain